MTSCNCNWFTLLFLCISAPLVLCCDQFDCCSSQVWPGNGGLWRITLSANKTNFEIKHTLRIFTHYKAKKKLKKKKKKVGSETCMHSYGKSDSLHSPIWLVHLVLNHLEKGTKSAMKTTSCIVHCFSCQLKEQKKTKQTYSVQTIIFRSSAVVCAVISLAQNLMYRTWLVCFSVVCTMLLCIYNPYKFSFY